MTHWSLEGNILITGGTGSLGNAIVRRAKRERWECSITILSRDEVKQSQMQVKHPECRYLLGDVRDRDALDLACQGQTIVVHAAAYKRIPTAEVHALEAVKTNVCGSCNVALSAVQAGVEIVVGISTDKAACPVNLYGQTKAVMEAVFRQANAWGGTRFQLTRYGNVIGSRGSIVPLFRQQAAAGGPLTITDLRMNRFWLSLDQAVDLIIQAARDPVAGSIIVPMLPSARVSLLAEAVAPGLPILDVGIRPGEKIDEHLLHRGESLHAERATGGAGEFFRVHPAASGFRGALPDGYEYRTDTTDLHLTVDGLRAMIAESEGQQE